jgi:hypothetical protein
VSFTMLVRELVVAGKWALTSWRVSFVLLVHERLVAGG